MGLGAHRTVTSFTRAAMHRSNFVNLLVLCLKGVCSCPSGWTEASIGGLCLTFQPAPKSWQEAQNECVSRGGHLATIQTATDNSDVISFRQSQTQQGDPVWLGMHIHGGNWTWTDRNQVKWAAWDSGSAPSTTNPDLCGVLTETGKNVLVWSYINCAMPLAFICQFTAAKSGVAPPAFLTRTWRKIGVDERCVGTEVVASVTASSLIDCVRQCHTIITCYVISFTHTQKTCDYTATSTDAPQLNDASGWETWVLVA